MRRFSVVAVAVFGLVFPGLAGASTWKVDSSHASAQFAVRHLMVSTVRGTLGKITGTLTLEETDITKSSVEATIDVAAIDTREPKRDEHLRGPDFFDVAKFPNITFKSKQVVKTGDTKFQVTGDLTMRGVTREVVLEAEGSPTPFKDPFGNTRLGGVATTKLNRKDFGIEWNKAMDSGGVVVGDEVNVTIDIEFTQVR